MHPRIILRPGVSWRKNRGGNFCRQDKYAIIPLPFPIISHAVQRQTPEAETSSQRDAENRCGSGITAILPICAGSARSRPRPCVFDVARQLFARNHKLRRIISQISQGAERHVHTVSGFADFAYERLILEFKRDLSSGRALTQAKKQLWSYFRGLRHEEEQDLFGGGGKSELWRLVATDGVVWARVRRQLSLFRRGGGAGERRR